MARSKGRFKDSTRAYMEYPLKRVNNLIVCTAIDNKGMVHKKSFD